MTGNRFIILCTGPISKTPGKRIFAPVQPLPHAGMETSMPDFLQDFSE